MKDSTRNLIKLYAMRRKHHPRKVGCAPGFRHVMANELRGFRQRNPRLCRGKTAVEYENTETEVLKIPELAASVSIFDRLKEMGIPWEKAKEFGMDCKMLTKREYRAWYIAAANDQPDPVTGMIEDFVPDSPYTQARVLDGALVITAYNYVRLHDGTKIVLHPPTRTQEESKLCHADGR